MITTEEDCDANIPNSPLDHVEVNKKDEGNDADPIDQKQDQIEEDHDEREENK
jgi:hypothetical protein